MMASVPTATRIGAASLSSTVTALKPVGCSLSSGGQQVARQDQRWRSDRSPCVLTPPKHGADTCERATRGRIDPVLGRCDDRSLSSGVDLIDVHGRAYGCNVDDWPAVRAYRCLCVHSFDSASLGFSRLLISCARTPPSVQREREMRSGDFRLPSYQQVRKKHEY